MDSVYLLVCVITQFYDPRLEALQVNALVDLQSYRFALISQEARLSKNNPGQQNGSLHTFSNKPFQKCFLRRKTSTWGMNESLKSTLPERRHLGVHAGSF